MEALIILPIIVGYLVLLAWAPLAGYRYAIRHGYSRGRRKVFAVLGFLVVFLPVFWDWLPTYVAFNYYERTLQPLGFTQFKSLEQWKAENPGAAELVRPIPEKERISYRKGNAAFYLMNDRFMRRVEGTRLILGIGMREEFLVDSATGVELSRYRTLRSGGGNFLAHGINSHRDLKPWLTYGAPRSEEEGRGDAYFAFTQSIRALARSNE